MPLSNRYMKTGHIIALALALLASHPVYATSRESEAKVHVVLQQTDPEGVTITSSENRIQVANAPIGSKLEIYSVVGIKVKEIEIKQSTAEYTLNIAKGYYIIRIGETVRKVAIR